MHSGLTTASRRTAFRRARGGAMVEFALLNIILIPLFLYALFLMDAAYLKLDLQETVVSGIWDFSQRNTEPPGWSNALDPRATQDHDKNDNNEIQGSMRAVRVAYADHTSAFDDGTDPSKTGYGVQSYLTGNGDGSDAPSMSGHEKHHTGFGARYSFRFKNGPDTQFLCYLSSDMNWTVDPAIKGFADSGYNAGNEVKCEATGFIYNYIIPQTFLQEFSQVDVTKMEKRVNNSGDGTHQWQGQGGNVSNIVAYEVAGISFNTWALRNGATNDYQSNTDEAGNTQSAPKYDGKLDEADLRAPDDGFPGFAGKGTPEGNPFYRRVRYVYTAAGPVNAASYLNVLGKAEQFMSKASSELGMILPTLPAGTTTNDVFPNMAGVHVTARYKPGSPGQKQKTPGWFGGKSYYSTPYDGPNSDYKSASDARGDFYMGCQDAENPNCF